MLPAILMINNKGRIIVYGAIILLIYLTIYDIPQSSLSVILLSSVSTP